MKQPKKTQPAPSKQQLRIIAGQWRGRKLPILTADGLRPTGDRLRETLFNWLTPYLPGARCLDLFAGTGALGLEALSRGADSVTMIESQREVAAQLRSNCATLKADRAELVEASALRWLDQVPQQAYDVLFIDPPFSANLWQQVIDQLEQRAFLADEAFIYVETPKPCELTPPANWTLFRSKAAGAVCARLFIRQKP